MKITILSLAILAFALSATGQSRQQIRTTASQPAAPHMPVQKDDAALENWVKQYPQEAAARANDLKARMQAANQSTPAGQQEYDQMKIENNHLAAIMRRVEAARATNVKTN